MDFYLSEEQKLVRDTARDFAENQVKPLAAELDSTSRFPAELIPQLAEMGFMGVAYPEKYGGAGMDYVSYAIVIEEISRACASTGVIISAHSSLACDPIYNYGTEEQKMKFLKPMASGKKIGCLGLTEPGAGSDAANVKTTSELVGNEWIINGTKLFITNGGQAEVAVTVALPPPALGLLVARLGHSFQSLAGVSDEIGGPGLVGIEFDRGTIHRARPLGVALQHTIGRLKTLLDQPDLRLGEFFHFVLQSHQPLLCQRDVAAGWSRIVLRLSIQVH